MNKAIYAFSGDPITNGHINIIKRALAVFDQLVVGIGVNPKKKYLFSLEERTVMAKRILQRYSNVSVIAFEGLLVDYAYENGISTIIRGVRNSEDFNYEILLSQLNNSQKHGIDTFFLPALKKYLHVSSSAVKALQMEQGFISEFVPLHVKERLEEKLSGQHIIGISGEIGSGKSYIAKKLTQLAEERNIPVTRIDMDTIGHEILGELREDVYRKTREQIIELFGHEIVLSGNFIDRKRLGKIVFNDLEKLHKLNQVMLHPILLRLRRKMYQQRGIILLESALILEAEMAHLCNNNLVLVRVDRDVQMNRLKERNYSEEQIESRLNSQYTYLKKRELILARIERDHSGKLFEIDNSREGNEAAIGKLFKEIIRYLSIPSHQK